MSREEYIPRNEKNLGDVLGTQYRYSRGSDGGVSTGSSLDEERMYDDPFEPEVNPVMSSAGRNPAPPRQAYQTRDSEYHLGGPTRWTQDIPREMMADYPGGYDRREQSSRRGSREGRRPTSTGTNYLGEYDPREPSSRRGSREGRRPTSTGTNYLGEYDPREPSSRRGSREGRRPTSTGTNYLGEYDPREPSSRRGSREGRRPTSIGTDRSSRSSRSSIESEFEEIYPEPTYQAPKSEPTQQAPVASNRNTRTSSQFVGSGGTVLAPAYKHRHESGNWHAYPMPQTAEDSNLHGEPASPKRYLYPENVRGGEIEEGREDGAHDNDDEHEPQVMNFLPVFSKPVFAQLPGKSGAIVEML